MTARRRSRPLPPPPPAGAEWLTKTEAAGYFRVRPRQVDEWRRLDATFPRPRVLSGGTARWAVADLRAWAQSKAHGFCTMGGSRRRGVACEESPSERLKKTRRVHAPCEAPDGLRDGDSSEAAR